MKKPTRRRTASKPTNASSVDEYFAKIEGSAREQLGKLRETIRSVLPADATEVISYRMPAFKQKKIVVWYAAFANHCSLFPGGVVLEQMKDELAGYVTSKGTVQFPLDKQLPTSLVKKIVKKRLAQVG